MANRYWVGGTANWDATAGTKWATTSGGAGGAAVPGNTDDVFFDAASGAVTVTITATATCKEFDSSNFTGTIAGSSALNTHAGTTFTIASTLTWSYTGTISFLGAGLYGSTTAITINKTLASPIIFNGGGLYNLRVATTTTGAVTLTSGALILDNDLTCASFSSSGTGSRMLLYGEQKTLTLTGSGTVWDTSTPTNLLLGKAKPNNYTYTSPKYYYLIIKLTDASASAKTFAGGGLTFDKLWITGSGTGTYTISGSNTFDNFTVDTPPHTIKFTAGTTTSFNTLSITGTAGNLMTLESTSAGVAWTLKKLSSGNVDTDYLSVQDCTAIIA